MSFTATSWAYSVETGSAARKAVLVCLADHMNADTGLCCPGIARIAARTELSERCVQICLRELEAAALLTVQHRGGRRSSLYKLAVPEVQRIHPAAPDEVNPVHPEPEEERFNRKREPRVEARAPAEGIVVVVDEGTKRPAGQRRMPLPDDWAPDAGERQMALDAGHDPNRLMADLADWARETQARSADWHATWRRWVRREAGFGRMPRGLPPATQTQAERETGMARIGYRLNARGEPVKLGW